MRERARSNGAQCPIIIGNLILFSFNFNLYASFVQLEVSCAYFLCCCGAAFLSILFDFDVDVVVVVFL